MNRLGVDVDPLDHDFISVLNCIRLLTRILPYIFEDPDWRGFFWSTLPGQAADDGAEVSQSRFFEIVFRISIAKFRVH